LTIASVYLPIVFLLLPAYRALGLETFYVIEAAATALDRAAAGEHTDGHTADGEQHNDKTYYEY
jgi:hypothetical protein